jgi:hypothetical protein
MPELLQSIVYIGLNVLQILLQILLQNVQVITTIMSNVIEVAPLPSTDSRTFCRETCFELSLDVVFKKPILAHVCGKLRELVDCGWVRRSPLPAQPPLYPIQKLDKCC